MELTSSAFDEGDEIPEAHTCDGEDISPPMQWEDAPDEAKSFVIVCEDLDSGSQVVRHWGIYDIPEDARTIQSDLPPRSEDVEFKQAKNDFGTIGWGGPCPPREDEPHRYRFRLYALSIEKLQFPEPPRVVELKDALRTHELAQTELTGLYGREQ